MNSDKNLNEDAGGGSALNIQLYDHSADRLRNGEAYMMCNECVSKLYSFDGDKDASRSCPKKRNGECVV